MRCTRMALVEPGVPGGLPATMTTRSPSRTRPSPSSAWSTCRTISSVCGHLRGEEGLDAPDQGELAAYGLLGGERQQRDRRAQPGHPPRGVAALGEGDEEPRAEQLAHLGGGPGDGAALGARAGPPAAAASSARRPRASSTIRAIVWTATIGCLPTLVSPESISASVPSSTALATSDASARVGRDDSIIDSSIWVATMTGLAARRARAIARFCTRGTSSSGSSTPRSPRATMMPSKASTISARWSTACGFSILASTGSRTPSSSMIRRTSSTSAARPHERQRDQVGLQAQRPAQVLDVLLRQRRHADTATPGRLMPLWSETRPPSTTRVHDARPVDPGALEGDLAVVDEQAVADAARRRAGRRTSSRPRGRRPGRPRS